MRALLGAQTSQTSQTSQSTRRDWEEVLVRLRRGDMPPATEPLQPDDATRTAMEVAARLSWEGTWPADAPERRRSVRTPLSRRLTTDEWERSVRDVLGVELDVSALLPVDEIGEGFTTTADTLSISPLHIERYLTAAEHAAQLATTGPKGTRLTGTPLTWEGGGRESGGSIWLHSAGDAITTLSLREAVDGELVVTAAGQQAGDEPVRLSIGVGRSLVGTVTVRATPDEPAEYRVPCRLGPGDHRVRVRFINDYYAPDHPDPEQRDRNAQVVSIELQLANPDERGTRFEQAMSTLGRRGLAPSTEQVVSWLTERAWRGEAPRVERAGVAEAVRRVQRAAGSSDPVEAQRAAIVAVLTHPRFIFRLESPSGSPTEYAARLASFLWGSIPDSELLAAADDGTLGTREGAERQVRRLLDDQRSRSIAERFATQWLQVDRLESQTFDGGAYGALDDVIRQALREETVTYFDWVIRSGAPATAVVQSGTRVRNDALAAYYGEAAVEGTELRVFESGDAQGGGVLRHGSVLASTSLPTRTSPVIRGKFVLEALLDRPPAPPPPEIPKLDEASAASGRTLSMREKLERHRADPSCAACHHTMDELGFALESRDAIGRPISGADDRGRLPDGVDINGLDGLERHLATDPALRRSVIRHLAVFALGRRTSEVDWPELDRIDRLGTTDPSLRAIVIELALSPCLAGDLAP